MKDLPDDDGIKEQLKPIFRKKLLTTISPGSKYLITCLFDVPSFFIKAFLKVIEKRCRAEDDLYKKFVKWYISLITETYTSARNLIRLTSLSPTIEVELELEHQTLNYAKGVIYSSNLKGITENLLKVNKILKNIDNEIKETGLIIITFAATSRVINRL